MPAQLIALTDGPNILVDKPILLVGRHPECDVQIESRKISRRHCCIAHVNDYLVVRDLDSTNGIRINGVRVVEGKLEPGDELTIGNHRYQVTWDNAPAHTPAIARVTAHKANHPAIVEDDDDLLEACDEPVPLPDPVSPRSPISSGAKTPHPRGKENDSSFVLPDKLELLPNPGSCSDVSGPSSPK